MNNPKDKKDNDSSKDEEFKTNNDANQSNASTRLSYSRQTRSPERDQSNLHESSRRLDNNIINDYSDEVREYFARPLNPQTTINIIQRNANDLNNPRTTINIMPRNMNERPFNYMTFDSDANQQSNSNTNTNSRVTRFSNQQGTPSTNSRQVDIYNVYIPNSNSPTPNVANTNHPVFIDYVGRTALVLMGFFVGCLIVSKTRLANYTIFRPFTFIGNEVNEMLKLIINQSTNSTQNTINMSSITTNTNQNNIVSNVLNNRVGAHAEAAMNFNFENLNVNTNYFSFLNNRATGLITITAFTTFLGLFFLKKAKVSAFLKNLF